MSPSCFYRPKSAFLPNKPPLRQQGVTVYGHGGSIRGVDRGGYIAYVLDIVGADPDARAHDVATERDNPSRIVFRYTDTTALLAEGELASFLDESRNLSTALVLYADIDVTVDGNWRFIA
ncbi:hypothetical protein QBC39DRAFT_334985 [Podospora conica]|nr:hypothetical protein QBC39DRAFT_334985 [Schizothecium conicum]